MTQSEIREMIKNIECRYNVFCCYTFERDGEHQLIVWPKGDPITFKGTDFNKNHIEGKLNEALELPGE